MKRRGRWVVAYVDQWASGKRFSSLSRARRFARAVSGNVFRFRRSEWDRMAPWVELDE